MNFKNVLLDVLLGFILPLVIGFLVMWKLFLTPGTIFHGDLEILFSVSSLLSELNYAWIPQVSSGWGYNAVPWILILMFAKLFGLPNDLTVKLWVLLSFALSSFFIYLTLRLLLPKKEKRMHYIACLMGLITYMFNQVVISELIVPHMLLSFSALPLFSILFVRFIQQKKYKDTLEYIVGIAVISMFLSIYPPPLFFAILFVIFYFTYRTLKYKATLIIKDLSRTALMLFIFALSNSFWIIPMLYTILYIPESIGTLYAQSSFSLQELYTAWNAAHGWNTINSLGLIGGFGWPYNQQPPNIISASLSLVLPILAFFSILLFKRFDSLTRKYIFFHSIAFLFFMTFADRDKPFIDLVADLSYLIWYGGLPLKSQLWTLIKQPSLFLPVIPYFYAFFIGSIVLMILRTSSKA
jgi:hypothetical protein